MGYKILAKKEICPNQYEIKIDAPYVVRNAQAGQFIIFRAEENGERVPLTIADVDKEKGELTLVFMAVGYSTKKLAELNIGDELPDIVGPLGKPTHIKKYGTVVCLAGGYGAAPCYLIAKAFKEAGANGIAMAEPAAGLLSPNLIKEFSTPYVKKIREAVEDENFIVMYHNCGNIEPLMDSIKDIDAVAYSFGNAINMEVPMEALPADKMIMVWDEHHLRLMKSELYM